MTGKRLAFISDIHGNVEALQNVLQDIFQKGIKPEDIYCLGDLVGYGPRPNEVIELIRAYNIRTVLGNYDEAVGFFLPTCGCNVDSDVDKFRTQNSLHWTTQHTELNNKEYLRSFEEELSLEIDGHTLLLLHGSPYSITDYVHQDDRVKQEQIAEDLDQEYNTILFGHTHCPYAKKVNDLLFVNAGSVGRPKDGDNRACYCILEFGTTIKVEFIRIPYNVEKVATEIEKSLLLNVFAQILRTGKDIKIGK